ncbi:MAG: class I SAM-dependent methyltransferase [Nanoarchaeota archaeon]|nr:class I SAM-dependent methyltransferase [Nanoarchaeota archaeon]
MSYKKFYEKQSSTFQVYIKNTNQKEILVKNIIKKLSSSFKLKKDQNFVFTDVGAGDGKVTIPIINFLKNKAKLTCNVIEPSDLIDDFKKNCNFDKINYSKKKIDDVKIPKSDFILVSHVLVYLENYQKTIKNIYASLKDEGIALIVTTNPKSGDVLLKIKLGRDFASLKNLDLTKNIINSLKNNNLKHQLETIPSEINTLECISLNEDGKAIISFFYHKPFDELTNKDIKDFQNAVNGLSNKDNKLTKKEDYIWILK